ncbi:MAG: hypothetical protein WCF71_12795, partial [Verrucomicrobiia bacterium]
NPTPSASSGSVLEPNLPGNLNWPSRSMIESNREKSKLMHHPKLCEIALPGRMLYQSSRIRRQNIHVQSMSEA